MGKSQEFKHKTKQEVKEIAEYLRTLAEGIDSGTLSLTNGIEQVTLKPDGLVDMEIKSKNDEKKGKIYI